MFNLNLRILRPADGKMVKLVKYDLVGGEESTEAADSEIFHAHSLAD